MKKIAFYISGLIPFTFATAANCLPPSECPYDCENPEVVIPEFSCLKKIDNVAQYKFGDWSGLVGISRGISRSEAMWIASQDPEITFFFYTKGGRMVLETPEGGYRIFQHGDAVFFKGEPQWGEANGLADGYVKKQI